VFTFLSGLALAICTVHGSPRNARVAPLVNTRAMSGPWTAQGDGQVAFDHEKGKRAATLSLDDSAMPNYKVTGEARFPVSGSSLAISVGLKEVEDPRTKAKRRQWTLLTGVSAREQNGQLALYPSRDRRAKALRTPPHVGYIWQTFSILRINDLVQISFGSNRLASRVLEPGARGLLFGLSNGAQVRNLKAVPLSKTSPWLVPLVLGHLANTGLTSRDALDGKTLGLISGDLPKGLKAIDNVPFVVAERALDISPSMAGVREPLRVKYTYHSPGAQSQYGRLVTSVPSDLYSALHLVAFSRELAGGVPRMTVRMGLGGYSAVFEDTRVQAPDIRGTEEKSPHIVSRIPVELADGSDGFLYHLRVDLTKSANVMWEISGRFPQTTLEFTRDVNVHVRLPDPHEFTVMPAGSPSSVAVLGATLEKSPVTVSYTTDEPCNIFYEGQRPAFRVKLTNRSTSALSGQVIGTCAGPGTTEEAQSDRKEWRAEAAYRLQPGETKEVALNVTPKPAKRGWYSCRIAVTSGRAIVQERETTFAIIAPDTRRAREDSPFGTWAWLWAHQVFTREDQWHKIASIVKRGGWRWAMAGPPAKKNRAPVTAEDYAWFKKTYLYEYNMCSPPMSARGMPAEYRQEVFQQKVAPYLKQFASYGTHAIYKVLHENRSSGTLLLRFNEFLGGEPYDMPEDEDARVRKQFDYVVQYCRAIKKTVPGAEIVLINDYPAVGIEYMKRGMPKDAFDYFGSEGAMFMREPERQPDWLSLLGNMHTWNRARKKYGYEDKPVWTT